MWCSVSCVFVARCGLVRYLVFSFLCVVFVGRCGLVRFLVQLLLFVGCW